MSGKGTFVNPKTGRPFHIDANHPSPKPPHVGVGRPRGARDFDSPKSRDFDLQQARLKITVEIGGYREPDKEKPCEVEIYCDKEGLDYLIKEL